MTLFHRQFLQVCPLKVPTRFNSGSHFGIWILISYIIGWFWLWGKFSRTFLDKWIGWFWVEKVLVLFPVPHSNVPSFFVSYTRLKLLFTSEDSTVLVIFVIFPHQVMAVKFAHVDSWVGSWGKTSEGHWTNEGLHMFVFVSYLIFMVNICRLILVLLSTIQAFSILLQIYLWHSYVLWYVLLIRSVLLSIWFTWLKTMSIYFLRES